VPRQEARKQFFNFVGGLNTEASPLTFPENTAKDLSNVDLDRDGSLRRRRGMDFEVGGGYSTTTFTDAVLNGLAVSTHEWISVGGNDTQNFLVVQIGGVLYFHKLGADVLSTSVIGSIDLAPIRTHADYDKEVVSADSAKGKLFVVNKYLSPSYIQYDADTNAFTGVKLTIKIRDIDGIDEQVTSPLVFGDDVTPPTVTVDPVDDVLDVLDPTFDLDDIDIPMTEIPPPFPGFP